MGRVGHWCKVVGALWEAVDACTNESYVRMLSVVQRVVLLLFVSAKWEFKYRILLPPREAQAALEKN